MKTIGLLSLTRFGDLIQTSPITQGLRRRYPAARIHLIIKSRFRQVAELLPGVDEIHTIDGDALARALSQPGVPFSEPYRMVRQIVDPLRKIPFDLLLNLTHSRASAVLLSLLDARRSLGFTLDRGGQRRVDAPWLVHMGTLVRARKLFRVNLVDVYLGAAGLLGAGERLRIQLPDEARRDAQELMGERLRGDAPILAIQLGASQDTKTWSVLQYARTLQALSERLPAVRPLLVGVAAEQKRADELVAACPGIPIESRVGRTSIPQLAAVLECSSLLLTGDTGTMHLAAAMGTPTCSIFVGLGNPYETAPYGEGHVALCSRIACAPCSHLVRCGFPVCHDDMPPAWVADLLHRLLTSRAPTGVPALPRADVLQTRFDENGLLELEPLHARGGSVTDLLALAYHRVFLEDLSGIPADLDAVRTRALRYYGIEPDGWGPLLPASTRDGLCELGRLGTRAARISAELAAQPLPTVASGGAALETIRARGQELAELDAAVYAVGRAEPLLAPLCLSLEGEAESFSEGDLHQVARESEANYRRLVRRCARLTDLFEPAHCPVNPFSKPASVFKEDRAP